MRPRLEAQWSLLRRSQWSFQLNQTYHKMSEDTKWKLYRHFMLKEKYLHAPLIRHCCKQSATKSSMQFDFQSLGHWCLMTLQDHISGRPLDLSIKYHWEVLPYASYCPDMSPSAINLFPNMNLAIYRIEFSCPDQLPIGHYSAHPPTQGAEHWETFFNSGTDWESTFMFSSCNNGELC